MSRPPGAVFGLEKLTKDKPEWFCNRCLCFVKSEICPSCGANEVVSIAWCDAKALNSYIKEMEQTISNLLEELHPNIRTDHAQLTKKALLVLGLSSDEINLYLRGELIL